METASFIQKVGINLRNYMMPKLKTTPTSCFVLFVVTADDEILKLLLVPIKISIEITLFHNPFMIVYIINSGSLWSPFL
jgi:hypothetical protein